MIIDDIRGQICGLWVDEGGIVHVCARTSDGGRSAQAIAGFRPFAWTRADATPPVIEGSTSEPLAGGGPFSRLVHVTHPDLLDAVEDAVGKGAYDAVSQLESQFLIQHRARLFADVAFGQLRRCQLDIETASADGSFSDAKRPEDRVLAIGLRVGGRNRLLVLEDLTDAAEKRLLESLNAAFAEEDPDVIEGHNLFRFDLDYLRQRCARLKVPCAWGRFGQRATFRKSRLKVAERWIDFPRCDLPGRTVIDTYLLVQLYDLSRRELTSFGLKDLAVHFGITAENSAERTYLPGDAIYAAYRTDRERFVSYLGDDLRETQGLADLLLPTYFEQTKTFPLQIQDAALRGTTAKIDLLFLEEYYHARHAIPLPPEVKPFEGGFTRSFHEGVFRHVLHFDVASLYPSLLLQIGRNPTNDALGVFIPLLRSLREYRLRFKQLARTAPTADERAEAQARQSNFKILINSFYGYLGFSGARFGDGALAAEVTARGRELLQSLIDTFEREGCTILEADTDGIYLASETYFAEPERLLARVVGGLPPGIDLEYDGRYEAMFCYKAKNYALSDGARIILRGSALRSRGTEPFLRRFTDQLTHHLLGASAESPLPAVEAYRAQLAAARVPVADLAKTEVLSQSPDSYERFIAEGGKPRRASAEAALQLSPRPRMGDRVSYYITAKSKGRTADWQRARPLALYDAQKEPYAAEYYLEKLDDWLERYGRFLGAPARPGSGEQGELF